MAGVAGLCCRDMSARFAAGRGAVMTGRAGPGANAGVAETRGRPCGSGVAGIARRACRDMGTGFALGCCSIVTG